MSYNETSRTNFDLVRLTKAKREVDVCPNSIRAYAEKGLRLYRSGRAVWFSRSELADFIKRGRA